MGRPSTFRRITVVGVGLLGGSVGLAAKAADERVEIVGVGRRCESLARALAAGVVDRVTLDLAAGVAGADLVVLATPLGAYKDYFRQLASVLPRQAILTDVGSTKQLPARLAARFLPRPTQFVGAHPMAGGERTGVEFARADLFADATCIITPAPRTGLAAVARVRAFWESLGCTVAQMSPAAHDRAVAGISHLPHALASAIVAMQRPENLALAGAGFADTTRIASGDPAMWREIFLANAPAVRAELKRARAQIDRLSDLIASADGPAIEKFLAGAKRRRDDLLAGRLKREE